MRHPGTFNANPLSAAAGATTLRLVANGEACRRASDMGALLRGQLNAMFAERQADWVVYGEFSGFKLLPGYKGPRPDSESFVPYGGDLERLDGSRNPALVHAFRRSMLLGGVDLPGLGGLTTAAHTQDDVTHTVAATAKTLELLRAEGLG
jgi:glutamate-1-semialdehyde 2,1-aminomutase